MRRAVVIATTICALAALLAPVAHAAKLDVAGGIKHFDPGETIYPWGTGYFPRAVCDNKVRFRLTDSAGTKTGLGSKSTEHEGDFAAEIDEADPLAPIPLNAAFGRAILRGRQKCGPATATGRYELVIRNPSAPPPVLTSVTASDVTSGRVSVLTLGLNTTRWHTAFVSASIEAEFLPGQWIVVDTVTRNLAFDQSGTYRLGWKADLGGGSAPAGRYRFAVQLRQYAEYYEDFIAADYTAEFNVAEAAGTRRSLPRPVDAQVNHAGLLVVPVRTDDALRVFNERFQNVATYRGGLNEPKDVGFAPDDTIYVADSGNDRIAVFSRTGTFQRAFRSNSISSEFGPQGIAVTGLNGGRVYVADGDHADIEVFDLDGTHVSTITGGLDDPFSIAVAPDGSLWVADAGTDEVTHFSSTGQVLGSADANFTQPFGVDVDQASGRVIVSDDSEPGTLFFFAPDGTFIDSVTTPLLAGGAGGVAAAGLSDDLFVVHPSGSRVLRFRFPQ